jgi:hypothetical protein
MEENTNLYSDNTNQLQVEENAKSYLVETAKWAKFLSIVGFIGIGLMIIMGIFMGAFIFKYAGAILIPGLSLGTLSFVSFIYIVIALLYIYPILKLYQFADLSKKALTTNDSAILTKALEAQKSMFKFMGIWVVVVLFIYVIIVVVALIGIVLNY